MLFEVPSDSFSLTRTLQTPSFSTAEPVTSPSKSLYAAVVKECVFTLTPIGKSVSILNPSIYTCYVWDEERKVVWIRNKKQPLVIVASKMI
jgi:hypothetical protein